MKDFFNLYSHGFARLAVATPVVRVGDPQHNLEATLELMREAAREKAVLAVFPELGLSAYTCDDLFHQQALIDGAEEALAESARADAKAFRWPRWSACRWRSTACSTTARRSSARGGSLGVVPKIYLPNYREFYEGRQFTPGDTARQSEITLAGQRAPFGTDLLFRFSELRGLVLHVEICEDLWVPAPPSSFAALAGATVIANLSASNVVVGKDGYRHQLVGNQSARCLAAYLYSAAGLGESTTDLAWDGHAVIYENGTLLAESRRFANAPQLAVGRRRPRPAARRPHAAEHLRRRRCAGTRTEVLSHRGVLAAGSDGASCSLERKIERLPYVPERPDDARRALRGGLPHPGAGAGDAHARHRHEAAGDRRLRRARLDAGAASSARARWTS